MADRLAIELLREWDWHNNKHHCYYEESNDSGVDVCPASFPTLRAFLESREFPVENLIGRFFGRDLDEPNFRSRISGMEKPVSIRALKDKGQLRRNTSVHYEPTTDAVLRERAQRASGAPVEKEQEPWEVQAMNYFNDRLDEIHESMVRAFAGVMADQSRLHTRIDALVAEVTSIKDSLDERSESRVAAEPVINVTLTGVPVDIAEELQGELDKRVARLLARRKQMTERDRVVE